MACFGATTTLEVVDMRYCAQVCGDVGALGGSIGLVEVGLGGTSVSGDVSKLVWRLSSLVALHLFDCEEVVGDVAVLSSLPKLVKVNIKGCSKLGGDKVALAEGMVGATMLKV